MSECQSSSDITIAFEAHEVDSTSFHHAEHVRVAFDLLKTRDFIDASTIHAKGIQTIAAKADAAQKFNLTITYAFMSLIAERMAAVPGISFDDFVLRFPEVMSKDLLKRWYTDDRLSSDTARRIFLLPTVA